MVTVTNITYASDEAIVATNWDGMLTDTWRSLPAFDNTTSLYIDVLVGGRIHFDTVTGIILAADSFDIYLSALYDNDIASSYTGGIDLLLTANDTTLAADVDLNPLNMKLFASVKPEATTADAEQSYAWGPYSVAALFGGLMPQKFILVGHNNSNDAAIKAATSDNVVNAVGVTYTHT